MRTVESRGRSCGRSSEKSAPWPSFQIRPSAALALSSSRGRSQTCPYSFEKISITPVIKFTRTWSQPALMTTNKQSAAGRILNPVRSAAGGPSAVNITRSLGSGCTLDQSCGVFLATLRDSPPRRSSREGQVTLVGCGLGRKVARGISFIKSAPNNSPR